MLLSKNVSWPYFSGATLYVHCNLVIVFMLGAKRKQHYYEMSAISKYAFSTALIALNICTCSLLDVVHQ